MGCLIVAIILILLLGGATWLMIGATFALVGLLLTLFVAGLIGWAADAVVPGRLPGGWFGAVVVGILGGYLGAFLFRAFHVALGPDPFGIHIIPAFVGALLITLLAELLSGHRTAQRYMR